MSGLPPDTRIQIVGHGLAGAILADVASRAGCQIKVTDTTLPTGASSSRVAAGLFTPVTGQRLTPGWAMDDALPEVHQYYPDLEIRLGISCFHPLPTLRVIRDEAAWHHWQTQPHPPAVLPAPSPTSPLKPAAGALWIHGGGWVNLPPLLDALTRERQTKAEWGEWPAPDLTVDCSGHRAATHPLWQEAGWRNAHGDILTLHIPGLPQTCIHSFGKFLLPLGNQRFRLGATYHWDESAPAPHPDGRAELEAALRQHLTLPFHVLNHQAGIRPVALARVPIIGPHPDHPRQWIFNGFGSKGVLHTPWLARRLVQHWRDATPLPRETLAPRRILRQRDRNATRQRI